MSFGFSLGDVITLVALTRKTYNDWRQAPNEYTDVVQTLRTSKLLICHVESRFEMLGADEIDSGKSEEIGGLLRGCRDTISELQEVVRRYGNLGRWDRFRMSPSRISDCKNRLARHITILTPFLMSLELESIGKNVSSVKATLDRLPQVLSNVLPAALGKMIDIRLEDSRTARGGSIMTTYSDNDDKQAWKDLRKHLRLCGIKDSVVRQHRTRLVGFVRSLTYDQKSGVGGVTGEGHQMVEASNVLGPLSRPTPQIASNVENPETVLRNSAAKRRAYQANVKTAGKDGDTTSMIPSPTYSNTRQSHANSAQAHVSSEHHPHVTKDDGHNARDAFCHESDNSCCNICGQQPRSDNGDARCAYSGDDSDHSNTEVQSSSSPPTLSAPSVPHPSPSASAKSPSIAIAGGQSIGSGALQSTDPLAYTLTKSGSHSLSRGECHAGGSSGARITIQDDRFRFQPDETLPLPRQFRGGPKRYRSGRGSSMLLDLSAFEYMV